ncbi:MAG: IS1 family transposase [Anaerolineales bacterium]|nr:IS1 family transposase [Anaerolineales bacterium]
MSNCPHCRQTNQQIKAGHNQSGSQRYICKWCGKTYTPIPKQRGYPVIIRKQAIQLYQEGHSYRAVARQMGIGTQSVINWVKKQ